MRKLQYINQDKRRSKAGIPPLDHQLDITQMFKALTDEIKVLHINQNKNQ